MSLQNPKGHLSVMTSITVEIPFPEDNSAVRQNPRWGFLCSSDSLGVVKEKQVRKKKIKTQKGTKLKFGPNWCLTLDIEYVEG